jgi:hypothetical protein
MRYTLVFLDAARDRSLFLDRRPVERCRENVDD